LLCSEAIGLANLQVSAVNGGSRVRGVAVQVPPFAGQRAEVGEQRLRQRRPREHVTEVVDDHDGAVGQLVQQVEHAGPEVPRARLRFGGRLPGEAEQVVALVVGQPQRPRQRREHVP